MGGGLASFFAPLRGTNPPCIRLPASVRSSETLSFWATRPRNPKPESLLGARQLLHYRRCGFLGGTDAVRNPHAPGEGTGQ